jgi:hypothetical protein
MTGALAVITLYYYLNYSSCFVLSSICVYVFVPLFARAYFIIGFWAVGQARK